MPSPAPRRALQFAATQPSFWPIAQRSQWADMYGRLRMILLLRLDGCGCWHRSISAGKTCVASRIDGGVTSSKIIGLLSEHDKQVRRFVLFWLAHYRPSESTHLPKAQRSITETPASSRFGMQQHYLGCYVDTPSGGLLTTWKYCGRQCNSRVLCPMVPMV